MYALMSELATIRNALRLTQADLAGKLGVHQSTISRFERGELATDQRTLLAAKALLAGLQSGGNPL